MIEQDPNGKIRILVCGSRFGQFYLEAVKAMPEQFELVGLLAKGSERSRQCARRYEVKLYTDIEQIPGGIDLACVVLRSGVMGGDGTALALALLEKGMSVLQEHPVHHKDMATCLRTARQHGVYYGIGDLYAHLPAIRRFAASARTLLARQPLLHIDAACAAQVSYPLIHILMEALPTIRPLSINHVLRDEGPFRLVSGLLGGVPLSLRVQHEVDPYDSDNHLHLLHSLSLYTAAGRLSLVDTHGPVLWHPRLHVPDVPDLPQELQTSARMEEQNAEVLGTPSTDSYRNILLHQWTAAIGQDLLTMRNKLRGVDVSDTRAQQELLCSRQWQELTQHLGAQALRPQLAYQPFPASLLKEAATQAFLYSAVREETGQPEAAEIPAICSCTHEAESAIRHLTAQKVKAAVEQLERAALLSMLHTLQTLGKLTDSDVFLRDEDIGTTVGMAPRHHHLLRRWLRLLTGKGYLKQQGNGYAPVETVEKARVDECWEAAQKLWEPQLAPRLVIDYFRTNAIRLPELLRDEQQAAHLLFPEGRMEIAGALYHDTAMARYLNKSVAEAVTRMAELKRKRSHLLAPTTAAPVLRILELGAGTGATTDEVVSALQSAVAKGVQAEYTFTDISPFFLAAARKRYSGIPWLDFRIIDVDGGLAAQGLEREGYDIIIAAGMLNNARDTDAVVREMIECLSDGGWLLITEPTREYAEMLISQAFMMTRPVDDRAHSDSTFMSAGQWLEVLAKAGTSHIHAVPGPEHALAPLGQKLFMARKGSPC